MISSNTYIDSSSLYKSNKFKVKQKFAKNAEFCGKTIGRNESVRIPLPTYTTHVTKILLAEKFINVDFLVPFPKFEMNVSAELGFYINKLAPLWSSTSWQCHLDYSSNFQKNDSTFDIDWLLRQVENEVTLAEQELDALRVYTSSFLNVENDAAQARNRQPRAAPLAMMALASVGLFGSGIALGSGECGLRGLFGSCHDRSKANAANIEKLAEFTESLTQDVFKLRNEVNDKFFMVTTELDALKSVQQEMLEVQNRNWKLIAEHFEVFQHNIHVLRDCDQLLFTRQQINFNYDTISSLLALTFANIKSYRGALYTYKINMMNSIQPILNQYLPMSLVPRAALTAILDDVASEQWRKSDRLSLAIPMDEIIAYYESQLLRDVLVVEQGLIMRIAIPLATKDSAFTVFRAIAVPMPQPEQDSAIKWKLEAPYLAISENNKETAFLADYDLSRCIGSTRYQICLDMIATETGHDSCLATLYFKDSVAALQVCETEQIVLPATEKAENLGFGVWLITSATTAYTLFESDTESTTSSGIVKYPGCRICIVTLNCGKQLSGDHIKIRSDLSTCEEMPAIKVNVKLPDPLQELWSELPEIDEMPYYSTKTEAGVAMLKEVRETLLDSPKMRDPKKLLEIARPITTKMTQLRPSLTKEFESHLSIKHSLLMSLISFVGSMVLHVIVVWIYHRYKHRNPSTPLWCGLFCPKRSQGAIDPAPEYESQMTALDSAHHDYAQKVRSFSRETLKDIGTGVAINTLTRKVSEPTAPQQLFASNYQVNNMPGHYKSLNDVRSP